MKALILAAGCGSRLEGADRGRPKGLIEVGGQPILDRQLAILEGCGIDRICLATGFGFDLLESRYAERVDYRHNPFYRDSNNMVSFMFARDWIDDDLIVLYADLLYDPSIIQATVGSEADIGFVVDRDTIKTGHTLVSVKSGLIDKIDRQLEEREASARHLGIGRFSRQGLADMLPELENAAKAGQVDQYYYVGAKPLLERGYPVKPIDVSGRRWADIDHPEDLERARREWGY